MGINIKDHLELLDDLAQRFGCCIIFLAKEEEETNDAEVMDALQIVLQNLLRKIYTSLISLKEEIVWSLLDDEHLTLKKIYIDLKPALHTYKEYPLDADRHQKITDVVLLFEEGCFGFRQNFLNENYYEELFVRNLELYRTENEQRLETIYLQDCTDIALKYSDENELKNAMVEERRKLLFDSRYGKEYHDQGRSNKLLISHIIDQHETDLKDINIFFDRYLAYLIAKEHSKKEEKKVFNITLFKENVDVDRVIRKLHDFIGQKIINAQIHWFIVYKVFITKNWLINKTQKQFVDQMNSIFGATLKCSKADFHEVKSYFKNKDFSEWTLEDYDAPSCCNKYREIADKLDHEFQDARYAKPGTTINTPKIVKFR